MVHRRPLFNAFWSGHLPGALDSVNHCLSKMDRHFSIVCCKNTPTALLFFRLSHRRTIRLIIHNSHQSSQVDDVTSGTFLWFAVRWCYELVLKVWSRFCSAAWVMWQWRHSMSGTQDCTKMYGRHGLKTWATEHQNQPYTLILEQGKIGLLCDRLRDEPWGRGFRVEIKELAMFSWNNWPFDIVVQLTIKKPWRTVLLFHRR